MLAFITRVLIVTIVFLAGALVGNIYMPQKRLEHASITSIAEPQTSLNLKREPNLDNALKAVMQSEAALSATGMDPEILFAWTDLMQRTIVLEAYRAAKANYELELLKVQNNPTQRDAFLKAQDNYQKIKTLVETAFPQKQDDAVEILAPQNGAAAAAAQGPETKKQ